MAGSVDAQIRIIASMLDKTGPGASSVIGNLQKIGTVAAGLAAGALGILAGAAIGAGVGIAALVVKTAAAADEIVESAEKIGISAEQYQEFKVIGDQVGTSVEAIGRAFARTTLMVGQAGKGNKDAIKTFKDLGVSLKDNNGNLKSTQDITFELISALGKMEDETQRDILAQKLFGRSFQELIPLINLGAEGAEKLTAQARAMGAIMGEGAVNAAADLHDKLGMLQAGIGGLGARIAGVFLPLVSRVADKLLILLSSPQVQKWVDGLTAALSQVADFLTPIIDAIGEFIDRIIKGTDPLTAFQVLLMQLLPPDLFGQIMAVINGIQEFIQVVTDFLTPIWEAIAGFVSWKDILIALGIAIATVIIPIIVSLISSLAPVILTIAAVIAIVALLRNAWEQDWLGIRTVIVTVWENYTRPILEALWTWLSENIPIALQILSDFWTGVLLPAIQSVADWIQNVLFPWYTNVWIPLIQEKSTQAIQKLSDFWTGTLQPAIQQVWAWISTVLIPFIRDVLIPFIQEKSTAAIQKLSDFWNNTLLPAIKAAWAFFNDYILPVIQLVIDIMKTLGEIAILKLTAYWQETLLPALKKVWAYFNDNILPILEDVRAFLVDTLGPKIQWFVDKVINPLANAIGTGLKNALQWVIDKLRQLLDLLQQYKDKLKGVPIMGESPSPLERSIRGIGAAIDELTRTRLPALSAGLDNLTLSGAGANGQPAGIVNNFILTAQYGQQSPTSLAQDVRMLQLLYGQ